MKRVDLTDPNLDWHNLIKLVVDNHAPLEVERDNTVVARISPEPKSMKVSELNAFFASLPSLGDDAEAFATDIDSICRSFLVEKSEWE